MVRYSVWYAEPAEYDLIDIAYHITVKLNEPVTALRTTETIEKAIESLDTVPHRCVLVDDERLATMGYRMLPVKNYIAFFTVDEEARIVRVERILYTKRDWQRIL
jgi:toxin ParE1/3/4